MSSRRRKLERRRRRRRSTSESICELCKSVRNIPVSRRWRTAGGGSGLDQGGLDQKKEKYDDIYLYND